MSEPGRYSLLVESGAVDFGVVDSDAVDFGAVDFASIRVPRALV